MPGMPPPTQTSSTLEPLFKAWGVKFDPAQVVGDSTYALQTQRNVGGRPVVSQNLPWIALRGDALARDEAILAQLSAIVLTNAGAFETTKDGVTLRPLLTASGNAVMIDAAVAGDRNADPRRLLVGHEADATSRRCWRPGCPERSTAPIPMGLRQRRPSRRGRRPRRTSRATKTEAAKRPTETLKRSVKPVNVILVGDADMLMDRNWIQQQTLFGQQIAQAFANNGDFVINAVEQMAGGAALSDLRGRGVSWRPFELIQRMEAEADQRYRAKEQQLTQELKDTEQKLAQMPRAAEGSNDVLTPEQMKAIDGFRAQLLVDPLRVARRAVRAAPQRRRPQELDHRGQCRRGAAGGGDHRIDIRNAPAATAGAGQGRTPIMNARQLIVLAGLAVVSVVATAAVMHTSATTVASDRRGEAVVPALRTRANELTGLIVRDGDDTMAIERRDNQLRRRRIPAFRSSSTRCATS